MSSTFLLTSTLLTNKKVLMPVIHVLKIIYRRIFTLHVFVNFTWYICYVTRAFIQTGRIMKFLTNIIFFDDLFAEKEYHSFVKRLLFIIEMPYSSISIKYHFCIYNHTTCRLSGIHHLANDLCRSLDYFCKILELLPQILSGW